MSDHGDYSNLSAGFPDDLPEMNERERADLEAEAGHPLLSNESAHRYRVRKIFTQSIADMLRDLEAK